MAIPDFQSIMLPLLKIAGDGRVRTSAEQRKQLGDQFGLSEEERAELLPSGKQPIFSNRVAWASLHLHKAELLKRPERGHYQITERGRKILENPPARITVKYLQGFPEFSRFRAATKPKRVRENAKPDFETPEEALETAYQQLRAALAQELLSQVKECSSQFFERLVVELLVKMGYGGSRSDAGKALGRTGDEGIDGMIKEDRLGLDVIYLQAKKWEGTVSRPEIQKFVGALQGKHARKGVFITTGNFSDSAREYSKQIDSKVVLIDGEQLAELMIDFNLGVGSSQAYEVKNIDMDYFTEE